MRYSGYIPDHMTAKPARDQLEDLRDRLHGDYGIPQDFSEVCGALIELTRIVENFMREQEEGRR